MPRINNPKPPKRAPKIDNRRVKKKPCAFCQHGVGTVDYKDLAQLRKYISDRGKIRGRRVSGNCQQHQRDVTDAIKTARELALLPDPQRTVTERRGRGRDGGRDGGRGPRVERESAGPAAEAAPEAVTEVAAEPAAEAVTASEPVEATEEVGS
ncbi:MAG: 30S ribosomal protein S18 [Acidobacteriota bacterium]|nr:30S ribosomal protein S18 [Acidobacteriota bacterium]